MTGCRRPWTAWRRPPARAPAPAFDLTPALAQPCARRAALRLAHTVHRPGGGGPRMGIGKARQAWTAVSLRVPARRQRQAEPPTDSGHDAGEEQRHAPARIRKTRLERSSEPPVPPLFGIHQQSLVSPRAEDLYPGGPPSGCSARSRPGHRGEPHNRGADKQPNARSRPAACPPSRLPIANLCTPARRGLITRSGARARRPHVAQPPRPQSSTAAG